MADFNVIIERGEDEYYISEVVGLPGCHTQAKTIDELMERTKEAIELCLEEDKDNISLIDKFIGLRKLRIENV